MDYNVARARAAMLTEQRPLLLLGNLGVLSVTGVVLWQAFPPLHVIAWCSVSYLLIVAHLLDYRSFPENPPLRDDDLGRWLRHVVIFSAAGGVIWGVGGVLFVDPAQPVYMIFMITVLMGTGTGAMPAFGPLYRAFAVFVVPMFVPVVILLLISGELTIAVLGALIGFFLVLILFFGWNIAAAITRSITVDVENTRLLGVVTEARDDAERANVDKSRFLASVSHDLRQPLAAMGLFLEALNRDQLESRNRELIDDIGTSYVALQDMCEALLEISRLDAGAVIPELRTFIADVGFVKRLTTGFETAAHDKGLGFEVVFASEVIKVRSDPVLLERVLRNLLSNAVKYTDLGHVRLTLDSDADTVRFAVTDTGHGIPATSLDSVFDEYEQLENPERDRAKGLGLGLSVVRRMCDLLEHEVEVRSEPGAGSAFVVTAPVGEGPVIVTEPVVATVAIAGLHVAVIDDEESIRRGVTSLLTEAGAEVTAEADTVALLAALGAVARPPDCLICDYRLRDGHTGVEAIDEVRAALDPELPALILTGDTHARLLDEANARGLYVLHKPLKVAHLMNVIGELVYGER